MAVEAAFEHFVFGSRHNFLIQSRLSYQILTYENGGELISFTTWAWVWRGIRIVDAFIIPSTCIRGRDIVIAPLVIPSTCIREIIPSTCIRERDIVISQAWPDPCMKEGQENCVFQTRVALYGFGWGSLVGLVIGQALPD